MGVPLQLILGIFLVVVTYSYAETRNLRQIREAPPPSRSTPVQNVTEINNRDLNKIIKNNPKTEAFDSKTKIVNNFQEFPPKLGKSEEQPNNVHRSQKNESGVFVESKEDHKEVIHVNKEKLRGDNARAIDVDTSKYWSSNFPNKNNVVTLSPTPNIGLLHTPDNAFEGTRHPSFDNNAELTTPSSILFDKKFKETVESVEQKLDDVDLEDENQSQENNEEEEESLSVDWLNSRPTNSSLEFVKSKTIVNNETVDKNSIHKNLNIEQSKKINFENIYNDTKVYDFEINKGETTTGTPDKKTTMRITTAVPVTTTAKSSLAKESIGEKNESHFLSNNIETEIVNPIKGVSTTTVPSTTLKQQGNINETKENTSTTNSQKITESPVTLTITSTTESTPSSVIRSTVSDQENIIPLKLGTESTIKWKSTIPSVTTKLEYGLGSQKETRDIVQRLAENITSSTTETIPTTTLLDTTKINIISTTDTTLYETSTIIPEEGTTILIIENATEVSDPTTTEINLITSTTLEEFITEKDVRTSKSMDVVISTEKIAKTSERMLESTTKEIDQSTETTIRNELDSTTLNNGKEDLEHKINTIDKIKNDNNASRNDTSKINTTTPRGEENITTSTKVFETSSAATEENVTLFTIKSPGEVEVKASTKHQNLPQTTTPVTLDTTLHIETSTSNLTKLLPEILSPNQNYSSSIAPENDENQIRKIVLENDTEKDLSIGSSTTPKTVTDEPVILNATTTEDTTETAPTENSFVKDGEDGENKGKIAAIAISCVGAVCLVLLAGLLYIMKKRQKRLNYGPRCRPVSLDDYSIDNLSVYNSVRRKGDARRSKRSFGNPAFDDPVAPTHPLNFPALARFSTNFEDIKAEFEEIPQITARTTELPDGCDTKNRYANVIPLPESRVFLTSIDGYPNSDYINANYVTGPKNIKGYYIATQGPMLNTVDDFWRMIWEQQTKVILMLTHLVENGLEKCVDYLPESETLECSRMFGDFQITLKKREVKEKYIISSLQLKNMVSNSWREVTHFWYLGWPEKGVPFEANSLIAFLIEARSYMKTATIDKKDGINGIHNGASANEHNPVVIHCSPGTGRTGVAIACDIAIREFETTRLVDIPKIVYKIRRDRANAIQTKEQYMFIYKVVSLYATKLTGGALENI